MSSKDRGKARNSYWFHKDNGEGGMLTLIATWIATVDLKTAVFKAENAWELQMLGNVYWSLFLRPDLALLTSSEVVEGLRINAKYVN